MKFILTTVLLLSVLTLLAQKEDKIWYKGELKLIEGTQHTGEINYNLRYQMIRIKSVEKTFTFRVKELESMVMFAENERHEFFQVAVRRDDGKVILAFGELLYRSDKHFSLFKSYYAQTEVMRYNASMQGATTVQLEADLNKDAYQPHPKRRSRLVSWFFLADYEGNAISGSKKGILEAYKPWARQIKRYASKNNLRFKDEGHLVRILKYAESLSDGEINGGD